MIHRIPRVLAAGLFAVTVPIALAAGTATASPGLGPAGVDGGYAVAESPESDGSTGSAGNLDSNGNGSSVAGPKEKSRYEQLIERCKTLPKTMQWRCYQDADRLPH
ncbi:hypothetical protein [Nocardia blacklockiae]|uniref:hypothetical protein n=1 Tax=Nocardia blacklockiae TaxID=480036 RepID=UPI00189568D2|nr:hypothetical protein [Nocardia blacklockiae]MBF6175005.1 hypothetical protein [Nocardia blacklockiae]